MSNLKKIDMFYGDTIEQFSGNHVKVSKQIIQNNNIDYKENLEAEVLKYFLDTGFKYLNDGNHHKFGLACLNGDSMFIDVNTVEKTVKYEYCSGTSHYKNREYTGSFEKVSDIKLFLKSTDMKDYITSVAGIWVDPKYTKGGVPKTVKFNCGGIVEGTVIKLLFNSTTQHRPVILVCDLANGDTVMVNLEDAEVIEWHNAVNRCNYEGPLPKKIKMDKFIGDVLSIEGLANNPVLVVDWKEDYPNYNFSPNLNEVVVLEHAE